MSTRCTVWLAAALLLGCASNTEATEKQLAELRADIVKLRAENGALAEKVDAITLARRSAAQPDEQAAAADHPDLDVVKLTPGAQGGGDDADEPAISIHGSGGQVDFAKAKSAPDADFDKALQLYKQKSYDKALEAFAALLVKSPDSPNADLATFYRGECLYAKSDWKRAAEQYQAVDSNYPHSAKAPDALYKLAQAQAKAGDKSASDLTKKKLIATFPQSDAAKKLSSPGKKP